MNTMKKKLEKRSEFSKSCFNFPNPFGIIRLRHITGVAALEHAPGIVSLTRRHRAVAFWGQFDATDATVTIIVS